MEWTSDRQTLPAAGLDATFETADVNLGSFLWCRGFSLEDIRWERGETVFVFFDSPNLRRAVVDYDNDGLVGARSFSSTLRDWAGLIR